jgi:hypothetical protein
VARTGRSGRLSRYSCAIWLVRASSLGVFIAPL